MNKRVLRKHSAKVLEVSGSDAFDKGERLYFVVLGGRLHYFGRTGMGGTEDNTCVERNGFFRDSLVDLGKGYSIKDVKDIFAAKNPQPKWYMKHWTSVTYEYEGELPF